MAKRLTTTEISILSGVSRGTVDRILHNRGGVSDKSRQKVADVLEEYGYKFNLHTSAVPFRKACRLLVCLPRYSEDDFWSQLRHGIRTAVEEYSDIDIELTDLEFEPFDGRSYIGNLREALDKSFDGVILSPVFPDESLQACLLMDSRKIPYIFVDRTIEGTNPVAVFSIDQFAGGHLAAMLADSLTGQDDEIGIFFADNARGRSRTDSSRRAGAESYFASGNRRGKVFFLDMDISTEDGFHSCVTDFLNSHPKLGGIAVANAHGAKVAHCLHEAGRKGVALVTFDLTVENSEQLNLGSIAAVVCQKPQTQGYKATVQMLEFILFHTTPDPTVRIQPIDIIFRDNLPWYRDLDR